jgi:hypothetical protein
MNDILKDITELQEALDALVPIKPKNKGVELIQKMIKDKEQQVQAFENQMELFFNETPFSTKIVQND